MTQHHPIHKTDEQWRNELTAEEYAVLREAGRYCQDLWMRSFRRLPPGGSWGGPGRARCGRRGVRRACRS